MGLRGKLLVSPENQEIARLTAELIGKEFRDALAEDRKIRREEAFQDRQYELRNRG